MAPSIERSSLGAGWRASAHAMSAPARRPAIGSPSSSCARICAAIVSANPPPAGRSRSAQNVRANTSGESNVCAASHTNASRIRCESVSISTRIGTSAACRAASSARRSSVLQKGNEMEDYEIICCAHKYS
jgi:hypothetical protein